MLFIRYLFQVFIITGNITSTEDVKNVVDKTVEKYGGIDILVHIFIQNSCKLCSL